MNGRSRPLCDKQEKEEKLHLGMQQGIQFEKCEIAKKLLTKQMSVELIAETTDLSVAEVETLKKELEPTKH